ncbi:hypothetical protein C2E23DRAFT_824330 [Lenzites betulinus]|nr:hypothetical protein C2E23DRAFT_824330 [Lenzites betulinus]
MVSGFAGCFGLLLWSLVRFEVRAHSMGAGSGDGVTHRFSGWRRHPWAMDHGLECVSSGSGWVARPLSVCVARWGGGREGRAAMAALPLWRRAAFVFPAWSRNATMISFWVLAPAPSTEHWTLSAEQ